MTLKDFFDNPEEFFVGAMLQWPLYFIVGWWVIPLMIVCALLWRLGGTKGGSKLFRRLGAPLVVCSSAFIFEHNWAIFLALPFMTWVAPSYGKDSWLYKWLGDNMLTRTITYGWYWATFLLARTL
jgi:energy-coupling factor transporter transmembrane protein EcfT